MDKKKEVRRRILQELRNRHLPITIRGDRITEFGSYTPSDLSAVWFDLREEYTTDEEAVRWLDFHFGKDSDDAGERLRYIIYRYVLTMAENPYSTAEHVRYKFLKVMADYPVIFDVCFSMMNNRTIL